MFFPNINVFSKVKVSEVDRQAHRAVIMNGIIIIMLAFAN